MDKLCQIICMCVIGIAIFSNTSLGLGGISEKGNWPKSWPEELEPYRKQARTMLVATRIQQNVYEIPFKDCDEFEKLWPTILKLKDKGAPLKLRSIEKPFKKGRLFDNEKPVVRIFSHVYPAEPSYRAGGKKLRPTPPWPDSIKSPTGELPEYVTISENGNTWIPVEKKKPKAFMYRVRTEIELVVDGTIINLNRILLPDNTPIIDKRKLDKKPETEQISASNRQETEFDIHAKVAQLNIDTAKLDDVIRIFGEPIEYIWGRKIINKAKIPTDRYCIKYPYDVHIFMLWDSIVELRFESPAAGYVFRDKIRVGSSLDEVLEVVGQPAKTVKGGRIRWVDNVLYKDIKGKKGYCYYHRPDQNVRFFFLNYKVKALYITRSDYNDG